MAERLKNRKVLFAKSHVKHSTSSPIVSAKFHEGDNITWDLRNMTNGDEDDAGDDISPIPFASTSCVIIVVEPNGVRGGIAGKRTAELLNPLKHTFFLTYKFLQT